MEALLDAPISLMAHLVDGQNQALSVGDSLGIPFDALQPGDVFIQEHLLAPPSALTGKIWIQTGVYRLDTLERYAVLEGATPLGDQIVIPIQ